MATFTERPDLALSLVEDIEADFQREREGKGTKPHVSDLIYCLRKGWEIRNGYAPPKRDLQNVLTLLLGHALHAIIARSRKLGRRVNVPIETYYAIGEADGVVDGFGVEDAKSTRQSIGKGPVPLTSPHYVEQIACYLVMLRRMGMRIPGRAIIHALHLMGNYKPPFPQLKSWEVLLSDAELARWELEIIRRAALLNGEAPPSGEHYDWECQYCPLSPQNGGSCPEREGSGKPASFFVLDPIELSEAA